MTQSAHALRRNLPWLLAGLSMIGPFSIDAIFPGFPDIGAHFGVGEVALQQTISVYLFAYAAMNLFHGAISDAYGRKPVIVTGMALYALASAGAAMSTSYTMLLVCRALQGLCAGSGIVVGRAVVRDTLQGEDAQKMMSKVMMIFGVAPAIAPMVGAWLLGVDGWRGIFWALTAFAALITLAIWRFLAESHPREARTVFAPRPLLAGYVQIARDTAFWPLLIASSINFAALFLYISSAPRLIRHLLHLSEQGFPWLFVPVVSGLVSGAFVSGRLAGRISAAKTVNIGYALMFAGCACNIALALLLSAPMVPWSTLPLVLFGAGVQMAFPTLTLLLLDRFPRQRGGASSVQAFGSLLCTGIVAGVLSPILAVNMLGLALGSTAMVTIGLLAWWWYAWLQARELARHRAASLRDVDMDIDPQEPV